MSKVVMGLGGAFVLIALVLLVAPDRIVSVMAWESRGAQLFAGTLRATFGVVLAFAAPATRYPKGMRVFGVVVVIAGLLVLAIPHELWVRLIGWLFASPTVYRGVGSVGALLFGAFLIQAGRPERANV